MADPLAGSWRALQAALIGFFVAVTGFVLVVYAVAPEVFAEILGKTGQSARAAGFVFLVALVLFITILCVGVVRRWRWIFWTTLLAFTFAPLQVVATGLEVAGLIPSPFPTWYTIARGCVALPQFALAAWMWRLWRASGVWGVGRKPRDM